jgi:lysophospholipase L1-like esterase
MRQVITPRRLLLLVGPTLCLVAGAATAQAPAAAPTAAFPGQYAAPPADRKYPAWPKGCARFEGDERLACLDTVASDFGGLYRYAAANAALAVPKPGEARVVFFGDSITDNWSKPDYGGFFPGKPYVNRGIGGQTTAQMLLRFRADVVELQPKAVVILAGTNDIAGNAGAVTLDQVQDNLASMAELARAHGIRVVLASLLPVSDDKKDTNGQALTRTRQRPTATIRELNVWLAGYAAKSGHGYLDYFTATADGAGLLLSPLNDDGLHPNARGYAVMAPLAEKAIAAALAAPAPKR